MRQVTAEIVRQLDDVEAAEEVRILLAVESGSRAWGFPSADSDYDVRFIYVHPRNWYLSIDLEHCRDVIERPLRDEIDLSGWDIRKALRLFRKSNPPLMEWLQSPIIYRERYSLSERLRSLLPTEYSARASLFHYWHMAHGNYREFLRGDTVWRKKYFYVLRPLLAILWIERGLGPVPMEFEKLVAATVADASVRKAIHDLIVAKRAGEELDRGPKVPPISAFIDMEMDRLEALKSEEVGAKQFTADLDELFRATLDEVWAS